MFRNIVLNILFYKKQLIEAIIDDAILGKTKFSSKAKNPSEKCGYHYPYTI